MLEAKLFKNPVQVAEIAQNLKRRGYRLDVQKVQELESRRKETQVKAEALRATANSLAEKIGRAKSKGEEVSQLMEEAKALNVSLSESEAAFKSVQMEFDQWLAVVPNLLHPTVPEGKNEDDNVEVRKWGTIPNFDFQPLDHADLAVSKGWMDFEMAAKITGSRFVVMYGLLPRLHRALIQFMLDLHTKEHGYQEVYVPYLVNKESMFGTGQFPKFKDDQFTVQGDPAYSLVPTAEVPVTNLVRDCILNEKDLPKKWVCHTPCFRRESGSYGKDIRGMIRQHQFEKVELVQIVHPEQSYSVLEEIVRQAETVLQRLELPYRVIELCSGDIGDKATKAYDIEVWLPGQNRYREISSISNFEAYQARRMQARFRNPETRKTEFVHTLNGSGLAIGRTLIAILENFQDKAGRIQIPKVLQPYMGVSVIE